MTNADSTSTALLTDMYELTMLDAALTSQITHRRATFEVFARRLPDGRGYGTMAGTARLIDAIRKFRFGPDELAFLRDQEKLSDRCLSFLEDMGPHPAVEISVMREGEVYSPNLPVMRVDGTFGHAVLIETLVLSVLNHDCAVASAASRMARQAGSRVIMDMGSRRTHETAAVHAARAAYLSGFDITSNLKASQAYGIPAAGTSAHAFTLSHASETDAFEAQIKTLGVDTTLLIDTYDIPTGVANALKAAAQFGAFPGAVRIDSGDLTVEVPRVREILDDAGATQTRIVVSGDLDEYSIAALRGHPVDVYGVGTRLVTGSGHPAAGMVYKAVSVEDRNGTMQAVAKSSKNKATRGGQVTPHRVFCDNGDFLEDVLIPDGTQPKNSVPLFMTLTPSDEYPYTLEQDRQYHQDTLRSLPDSRLSLHADPPSPPTLL